MTRVGPARNLRRLEQAVIGIVHPTDHIEPVRSDPVGFPTLTHVNTRRKDKPMHAVLVEVDLSGTEPEQAIRGLQEEVIPRVKQAPGFQSGTWTRKAGERRGLSLLLFDSEENAQAAAGMVSVGSNPQPGVTVERSEVREVVATA
jgi:hypothetical protein